MPSVQFRPLYAAVTVVTSTCTPFDFNVPPVCSMFPHAVAAFLHLQASPSESVCWCIPPPGCRGDTFCRFTSTTGGGGNELRCRHIGDLDAADRQRTGFRLILITAPSGNTTYRIRRG
ncbi:hypothetical protein KCP75_14175 [Salmonella enterica subsp. enterica]|nr:hypothetical protein KCP75_14175 [Salmonella enterica subsp. enterica]